MVEAKLVALSLALVAVSCAQAPRISWEKFEMDEHRSGTKTFTADNLPEAFGSLTDSVYLSPAGRSFEKGSATYAVAAEMYAVQPLMTHLKEVIAYSDARMEVESPECALADWAVDWVMQRTAAITGRRVDVGFLNFGGIRVAMPEGPVTNDDIVSMFPFRNYLSYVALKGGDLKAIFDKFAMSGTPQAIGGVKFVMGGGKTIELLVGGEPVDPEKIYGVATIDFLLDGGDNMTVAKNARELIITEELLYTAIDANVRAITARGEHIRYSTDGRIEIIGGEEQ